MVQYLKDPHFIKMSGTSFRPLTLAIIHQGIPHNTIPLVTTENTNIPISSTLEEKAAKNREHQRRYVARTKPFQQLAKIDNPEERIVALIMLSYPELSHLPKYVLHQQVDLFIRSLKNNHL